LKRKLFNSFKFLVGDTECRKCTRILRGHRVHDHPVLVSTLENCSYNSFAFLFVRKELLVVLGGGSGIKVRIIHYSDLNSVRGYLLRSKKGFRARSTDSLELFVRPP
jgi:hypothetical protein